MKKLRGPRGSYTQKHTLVCAWCGVLKKVTQKRATTCGGRCRLRLFHYRRETGFDPLFPPGAATTSQALEDLWQLLLSKERVRIMKLSAAVLPEADKAKR